jgi:glucosamine 6-phosphate synthetase-like amidotransferase/phosphosugar isomerase protein
MKIQVKIIKENPDGSANAEVDFDKAGLECLVQHGLISLLTQAIDVYKVKPEEDEALIQRAKDIIHDFNAKDKQLIKAAREQVGEHDRNFS